MAYYSSLQPVVVYNFREIESTFSVPVLKLHGRLLIALWHGSICLIRKCKYNWFLSRKDFSLFCLFFFYACCNLSAVAVFCRDNKFFCLVLNVFLCFLYQFAWKHFRIFVTVMRSKFHFLLKFSTRGTLKRILFFHVVFYLHGLIC